LFTALEYYSNNAASETLALVLHTYIRLFTHYVMVKRYVGKLFLYFTGVEGELCPTLHTELL